MTSPQSQEASKYVPALTEIWRQVLEDESLDENSDLFENGGSSRHVLQIVGEIYDILGIDVQLRAVFTHSSPNRLFAAMEESVGSERA